MSNLIRYGQTQAPTPYGTSQVVGPVGVMTLFPDPVGEPVVVRQQPIPPQAAYVYVGRPPTEFVAPPPDGRVQSLVVTAQQPLTPQPFVNVLHTAVPADIQSRTVVVAAQPLPTIVSQAFVSVTAGRTDPPVAAPELPPKPTIVPAWGYAEPGFVGWTGFSVDSGIAAAAPDVPPRPIVLGQLPALHVLPFVSVVEPKVFAAAPVAGDISSRPVVVATPEPPPPVDQVILFTVVSQGLPLRSTVVDAGPLPLGRPFTFVAKGAVDLAAQPPVPIKPTVVKAEPFPQPVQAPQVVQQRVDLAAQPPVPIKPTVVPAQPAPPQYGQSNITHGFAVALPPPEVPPRPTIVGAQPLPPKIKEPYVSWTPFDEKVVGRPQIIRQQPIPPQAPFISTPKGGRWGDPPPRFIQPQVNVDMSLPFWPHGWSRVAHGFEEALPLLFEGTITGGALAGSAMGGAVQNGYVTGGRL